MGKNLNGGLGGGLFFGYGITENFAMEIDWIPLLMASPHGTDVKDIWDNSGFGGIGVGGGAFGGFGVSGKLYPRGRFRDADFVNWQPFLMLGAGYMPFVFTYKSAAKPPTGESYDGFKSIYAYLGGGVEYMFNPHIGLNVNVRLWKFFQYGDSLQGYSLDSTFKSDISGSMAYQAGLGLTFQW